MGVAFTVVSIGTMSSNPFWSEPPGLRTPHATTTLVRDADRVILVDPSLPAGVLVSRLAERTGLSAEAVTDVFCTTLRPTHRRSIEAFDKARWTCGDGELQAYRQHLETLSESARRSGGALEQAIESDLALLRAFRPAPEKLTRSVHLYPLAGASVGSAGLLLAMPGRTVIVAGDAAITGDHVLAGRVWSGSSDAASALESLREIIEIADVIVCGHDNYMLSPARWMA